MMAKFGPLDSSEDCAGVSGLDDKLMTLLLLEHVDASGLLNLGIVEVVVVAVVVLVVGSLVAVVVVVVSPLVLLLCGRTTVVLLLSMETDEGVYYWFEDYDGIHFF